MNILLVYPRFPKSFWSFDKTLELVNLKAQLPPLGLVTVAAILPQTWNFKLVDRNVREVQPDEWQWADIVIVSAMIVHRADFLDAIQTAKGYGKLVAVGGPYPTSLPHEAEAAGADFLILDEGEITLPMFVEAVERGDRSGTFRSGGEKPDVTSTPIPRYDLLEMDAYAEMSIQFSRGCPFQCEFCDIIVLYGRKPRTKAPEQLLAELQYLYDLGWRRSIFMVDDNFIGNKRNVKLLLQAMKPWMEEHGYPFSFATEASVDLAQDPELMQLMVDCNFGTVFLGIETPDDDSLTLTKKFQNMRDPLSESVVSIAQAGLRVMAGFIVGFDGEKAGAGQRIYQFVEQTAIPTAMVSMLQALPDTALWHRLEKEGRLLGKSADINQATLMNFVPTRPVADIGQEYIDGFWNLYEPQNYLRRCLDQCLKIRLVPRQGQTGRGQNMQFPLGRGLRLVAQVIWHQGIRRPQLRRQFWRQLWVMVTTKPQLLNMYLGLCAAGEHFWEYRALAKERITQQLRDEAIAPINQRERVIDSAGARR